MARRAIGVPLRNEGVRSKGPARLADPTPEAPSVALPYRRAPPWSDTWKPVVGSCRLPLVPEHAETIRPRAGFPATLAAGLRCVYQT